MRPEIKPYGSTEPTSTWRSRDNWIFDFENGPFSISFWMKQNPAEVVDSLEYRYVIKGSHNPDALAGRSGKRYEVYYKPEKTSFRFAVDDNLVKSEVDASPANFITNEWVHVVAVRDTTWREIAPLCQQSPWRVKQMTLPGIFRRQESLFFGYCTRFRFLSEGRAWMTSGFTITCCRQNEIDSLYKLGPYETGFFRTVQDPDLRVYPNPASERITLTFPPCQDEKLEVKISDLTGHNVLIRQVEKSPGQQRLVLNIADLAPGFYCISVTSKNSFSGLVRLIIVK